MDKEIKSKLKAMVGNDKEALNVIEESACLDIFSELENDQEKTKDNKSIKEYINEAKKQGDIEDDLDKSFYTDSMHFDAKDFEDDVFENVKTEKKSRKALKIIAFILFLILHVVIGYFLYSYIK